MTAKDTSPRPLPFGRHHFGPALGDTADRAADRLGVRIKVRLVGGEAGRALASAPGQAVAALLATLGHMEVGQGEEDRSP